MRFVTLALAAVFALPTAALAIPISFGGTFGADTPLTIYTRPGEKFRISFYAPAKIGSFGPGQFVDYTQSDPLSGPRTSLEDAFIGVTDQGNGTDLLSVQLLAFLLGTAIYVTAPTFIDASGAPIAGRYMPSAESGLSIAGETGADTNSMIDHPTALMIGATAVPEASSAMVALFGFGLIAWAKRR